MTVVEEKRCTVTIDEALELTKFGKFNYSLIVLSGFVLINVVLESVGISFVLPITKCDLELSNQEKGILGAVGFVGIICSSHLWGFLADTTGRRNVIRPTLISGFLVTAVSSFSPNFITLAILRFVNGFLLSGGSATIFAYLGEFHCNKLRNRAIMWSAFISAISAIFLPILAWLVINQNWILYIPYLDIVYKPWRLYIVICGLPGLICGLWLFQMPESPKYLLSIGEHAKCIRVLEKMYEVNSGEKVVQGINYKVTTLLPDLDTSAPHVPKGQKDNSKNPAIVLIRSMWNQTAPLLMREHRRKTILACVIQFTIFFGAHGVYMWFPYILDLLMQYLNDKPDDHIRICNILYIMQSRNLIKTDENDVCVEQLEISTYQHTIVLELIYVGLLLSVVYTIGKFGRIPILFIILLVCGSCAILAVVLKIPIIAIYFIVIFLCCGLATTVLNAIVVDIYPTHLRAMAVCISLMLGRIGSVVGTYVLGAVIESSCEAAILFSGLSLLASGLMVFFIPKTNEDFKEKITKVTSVS